MTAADTVVFMEHDWNPMRDLQVPSSLGALYQSSISISMSIELKGYGICISHHMVELSTLNEVSIDIHFVDLSYTAAFSSLRGSPSYS